ncbi:nitroreductase family deazaflavin-dependent oxidoreductase [Desertimonas flava]|uniref:nitroreductase family deazaflavin-dependent oxidoreductase n=1 Tax=Desertimonas flava TaxID=2064846 RepID=UPI000E34DA83|nr:nitroreductase family deazaflavin-dependent oxidoreductase [Desertimonas flava]
MSPSPSNTARYLEPSTMTKRVFNPLIALLTRLGLSLRGSRELEVRGRKSGEVRRTVVNPLSLDGERFLVAPRGTTQWVRNLRAAQLGTLRVGRRREEFTATEVADADKTPIIRAYLAKWAWEVGAFFEGLSATSSDDEIAAVAAGFPVFRLQSVAR